MADGARVKVQHDLTGWRCAAVTAASGRDARRQVAKGTGGQAKKSGAVASAPSWFAIAWVGDVSRDVLAVPACVVATPVTLGRASAGVDRPSVSNAGLPSARALQRSPR